MLTFKMFPGIRERNISGFTYVNKAVFLTPWIFFVSKIIYLLIISFVVFLLYYLLYFAS